MTKRILFALVIFVVSMASVSAELHKAIHQIADPDKFDYVYLHDSNCLIDENELIGKIESAIIRSRIEPVRLASASEESFLLIAPACVWIDVDLVVFQTLVFFTFLEEYAVDSDMFFLWPPYGTFGLDEPDEILREIIDSVEDALTDYIKAIDHIE